MDSFYVHVSLSIIQRRNSLALTQEDLAKDLGVTQANYSMWESGKREFPAGAMLTILTFLKLDLFSVLPNKEIAKATDIYQVHLAFCNTLSPKELHRLHRVALAMQEGNEHETV